MPPDIPDISPGGLGPVIHHTDSGIAYIYEGPGGDLLPLYVGAGKFLETLYNTPRGMWVHPPTQRNGPYLVTVRLARVRVCSSTFELVYQATKRGRAYVRYTWRNASR